MMVIFLIFFFSHDRYNQPRSDAKFLVAVKILHDETDAAKQDMMREAAVMAQFHNENVIALVGVVTLGTPLMAVIEFCEHGSLLHYLKKHADSPKEEDRLRTEDRLVFASQCASGLMYLSSKGFM